jgi:hypothetical protein
VWRMSKIEDTILTWWINLCYVVLDQIDQEWTSKVRSEVVRRGLFE